MTVAVSSAALEISRAAETFGFSTKRTGAHLARSMMLPELKALAGHVPPAAASQSYAHAIVSDNVLGKPTSATRIKSLRHLTELYGLDPQLSLFRMLRVLGSDDPASLPLMAMTCAFCRDDQLRVSFDLVSTLRPGQRLERVRMEAYFEGAYPERFSAAMKKSLAQNVNTTWTEAGHLVGRVKKTRALPKPRMTASAYAMFAGYLLGLRGELLLNSVFGRLAGGEPPTLIAHLSDAAVRGYLRFRHAGGVVEIDFSPLLTTQELRVMHESR